MDGVYVIFILVEHHLSFFFYFEFNPYLLNAGDLSFGILIIWKLHQIHFVFFFIVLGY